MSYIQVNSEDFSQQYIEDAIGDMISGVTGLNRNNVRPAHQPLHPVLKQSETICVFNIHRDVRKGFWSNVDNTHYADRSEIYVNIFFYGLKGYEYCNKLIRGAFVPQNTYELAQHNMRVMSFSDVYEIPVNLNEIEITRHDVTMRVNIARNISYETTWFNGCPGIRLYTKDKEIIIMEENNGIGCK